jgi:mRNA interferase MazF
VVKRSAYVPDRGDIVWIDLNPRSGHEQAGRRPALVLSQVSYNRKTDLAVVCPITSQAKGYPFEVSLPDDSEVKGAVLSDQVRCLDWRARGVARAGVAPAPVVAEVTAKLVALIGAS